MTASTLLRTVDTLPRDPYTEIVALLRTNRIDHHVLHHAPEGNTDLASQLRKHRLEQAAKSIVVSLKYDSGRVAHCLAVVPGHCRVSLLALAHHRGARKAFMAERRTAEALSGCRSGSIPPLSLDDALPVLVDAQFAEYGQALIYFNAGRLDISVGVPCAQYLALIGTDKLVAISEPAPL
jgi:Ala-tRNA(Pro) deacylase